MRLPGSDLRRDLRRGVALSVGVHGLFVVGLWALPEHDVVRPPPSFRVELSLRTSVPIEVPSAAALPEHEVVVPVAAPSLPRSRPRSSAPGTAIAAPSIAPPVALTLAEPSATTADAPIAETETAAARRARLSTVAIGPRIAAERMTLSDDPGPTHPGEAAGLAPIESVAPLSVAAAEARHGEYLGERAAERPWIVETAIVLSPHPDGTYTWQSSNFTATIHPSGAVTFSDRGAVEFDLASGVGTFDLNDAIMQGAGADPFAYERQRFYDDNQELIEQLDDASRVRDLSHSLGGLRTRLRRIWNERGRAADRRAALFEEWNELSTDPDYREARDVVIEFIRTELPEGSRNAFRPSEIRRFDRARWGDEHFAPYE
jgi:hypothetical protein